MNKISKMASLFLAGTLCLGFASCGDDDDTNNDGGNGGNGGNGNDSTVVVKTLSAATLQSVANTYVNDIVYPTYTDLASYAGELKTACENLYAKAKAGTMAQADIDAACEAFKNARREWERSEAFLYGAATDNEIDPHIDSWPLDHDQLVKALNDKDVIAGINGSTPSKYVYDNNGDFDSVLGFHGLEFVLFRNGANRTVAALSANDTETGMTSVSGINELAFAAAVSGDIYNMTTLLKYGWQGDSSTKTWLTSNCSWVYEGLTNQGLSTAGIGYGEFLLNATKTNGYFTTWQETMENIFVGGCSNICQEVYTQKLGQAYRVATGNAEEEDAGDYIESPYSKRSFIDYQDNIYSIKNSLYGTRDITATTPVANSLMTVMKDYNYEGYNTLSTALDKALNALETAKNSGKAFVDDPGNAQVKTCIDAIKDLDEQLNEAGAWFRAQNVK